MPERPRDDNALKATWRRQLERERLASLAFGPGEDLPGPGAAAAAAIHATPAAIGGAPETWRRQLERDRLSMTAMEQTSTRYPGPGAAGEQDEQAQAGGMLKDLYDDFKGSGVSDALKSLKNPAAAAKEMADALKEVKETMPVLQSRNTLWQMMSTVYVAAIPLLLLPLHKIWYDPKITKVVRKVKEAVRKTGIPLPPQAQLIIKVAPYYTLIEWVLLLFIYGFLGFLAIAFMSAIGFVACGFSPSCLIEAGITIARAMKSIIF